MRLIGLTGGIATGKSTVARMLVAHGAIVIDADELAREVVRPGEPALREVAARFGDAVIRSDGSLDRDRLSIWFNGIRVAHKGARDPDYDEAAVSAAMKKPEIALKVALGLGKGRDRVLTCDLTKEYVAINGDYRS